jgi:AhpD family alkylhydroperoxidase
MTPPKDEKIASLSHLGSLFPTPSVGDSVRKSAPELYDAMEAFWHVLCENPCLSPRLRELILLARHGASSSLNERAVERHVQRALIAGASKAEIADVLVTIVPMANHPLYKAVPILMEELASAGHGDAEIPPMSAQSAAIKDAFIAKRGFWVELRDLLARLMPDYFSVFTRVSNEPWIKGSLSAKERELIYIAVDSSITQLNEGGIRMHVREAVRYGATRAEILAVLQLASLLGAEGYVLATTAAALSRDAG